MWDENRGPWMAARVAAAVAVVAVPVGTGALRPAPAPAAQRPAASPTVYAVFSGTASCEQVGCTAAVIPISTATNRAGTPIRVGRSTLYGGPQFLAITPNGKTVYVANTRLNAVIPISTATNTPGTPIHLSRKHQQGRYGDHPGREDRLRRHGPDLGGRPSLITPISTATSKPGHPITVGPHSFINQIAITPDGRTAYVATGDNVVVPISTAANTTGKSILLGSDCHAPQPRVGTFDNIAITPDGKTAYVTCGSAVVPISTAANTPGKPIRPGPFEIPQTIAITP